MKKINIITIIVLGLISLAFVILVSVIVPKEQFAPYKLELDSLWKKENSQQEYWVDTNNDQIEEIIRHHNINITGHSIERKKGDKLNQMYIFKDGEEFVGKSLKFADIDGNHTKELLFISVKNTTAYLNILTYDAKIDILSPIEKIRIDTVKRHKDKVDVQNNFIITSDADIYFDLQAGYSIQPRNIYKYNFKNKKLIKTKLNAFVNPKASHFNYKGKSYLLASYMRATSNTLSPKDAETLRNSTDKDTLKIYEDIKHLEYEYGDFSSYILLYNDSLHFAFDPIEFFAWTNFTKACIIPINKVPHIVAFTNAQMDEADNKLCKLVTLCNLNGEIIKQIPLPHNYTDIFSERDKLIFYGEKTLFLSDSNLNLTNEIKDISFAQGFVDIDKDKQFEFVAFTNNVLKVYSSDFELNASYEIKQEYSPYPEEYSFSLLEGKNKNTFIFNSRLFYYLFSYKKNSFAFFKYPFYLSIFIVLYGILILIVRIGNKRLEKENFKLEQLVIERTKEIESNKDEIQAQAEDLSEKNHFLEQLGNFKKMLTSTLVHDLKNPLNYIIGTTNDKAIRQSGYNMLNIVLNVLDVNKAQTTKLSVNFENCAVEEVIEKAVSQVEFLAEQKNLQIEIIQKKQNVIDADINITTRILVNLLTNAIKYSPLNNKVTIKVEEQNNSVIIEVIDYGIGIEKDNIQYIFEEYTQITAKNSGKIQSTGLGLTFCKLATEVQNAKIEVSSIPNKQTSFSLVFPLVELSEKRIERKTESIKEDFLSEEEKRVLLPILQKLNKMETFQASEILKLLASIEESSDNIKYWKQKVKNAMLTTNNELFKQLTQYGV